ncbi:MAG: hypothetical protein ACJLTB_15540 [Algoriphagus aquaeductus]|uniref:hypothetical protein n=1 Tax=Algoriphagus aquaeductus TaxID=475299 RepID=UPI00387A4683
MKNRKWLAAVVGVIFAMASIFFTAYLKKRRRDRIQNIITEVVYKDKEVKWVKNSFHGLSFESPYQGLDPTKEISDSDLPGVKTLKENRLVAEDLFFAVLYADLDSGRYDLELGMDLMLTNFIKEIEGSELNYNFKYGESWLPFALAEGEFVRNSEPIILRAFLSYNKTITKSYKLRGLVILGRKTDQNQELISKSISSVDLVSLKKEKNPLMLIGENGGRKFKNYDPTDTVRTPEQIARMKRLRELFEKGKIEDGNQ